MQWVRSANLRPLGTIDAGLMIRSYADHAANERTFLARARTGIAVIAFGFVAENSNLILFTIEGASPPGAERRLLLERLPGPFGRFDGLALILAGSDHSVMAASPRATQFT
jgi:uncharacterized membrane protein YidH (DUF202 family)